MRVNDMLVRWRSRVFLLAGLALAGAPPTPAADAVAVCKQADVDKWKEARQTSLGVKATDQSPWLAPDLLVSPAIAPELTCPTEVDFARDQDGRASDGLHDWVFAAPCKVTACGEPKSFEQNRALFWFSGEYDLNNNVAVEGDFAEKYLRRHLCFDDSSTSGDALLARQEPRLCFPPTETLHAEITPAPRLRPLLRRAWAEDYPYGWIRWKERLYPTRPWHDPNPDREPPPRVARVCAYGPFVADTGHAARAEIHPVQLLWWRENETPTGERALAEDEDFDRVGKVALFVMQDASARYTKAHHFVLSKAPTGGGWRPWAEALVDGTFTVPFWSDPADPPRFRLDPYQYQGIGGGAPQSVACDEMRVTALSGATEGERAGGLREETGAAEAAPTREPREETVASFCKAVRAQPPSDVQVDVRVDCYCEPKAGLLECPEETRGYLGRIVVQAKTGRRRDWSEGSLAMMLWDQRPPKSTPAAEGAGGERRAFEAAEARDVRLKQMVESLDQKAPPSGIVTWRPARGTSWERVIPKGAEIGTVQATISRIFDEADWPSLHRPLPSLWRLRAVDLAADAVVEDLGEGDRKSKRVLADFQGRPEATELLPDPPQRPPGRKLTGRKLTLTPPAPLSAHSARLTFPSSEGESGNGQELWRLEVPVTIKVRYRDQQGHDQTREAMPPGPGKVRGGEGRWTVWSHGLGAEPLDDWRSGVSALCDHYIGIKAKEKGAPVTPPGQDLSTIVLRAVKDEVVSLTELRLLVGAVRGLCGGEAVARSRPIPVQSK